MKTMTSGGTPPDQGDDLSEREDLLDQLAHLDVAMKSVGAKIERFRASSKDYRQLVSQMHQQGRYLDPRTIGDDIELCNRLLRQEVQVARDQLAEAEDDAAALTITARATVSDGASLPDKDDTAGNESQTALMKGLRALELDVKVALEARSRASSALDSTRSKAEEMGLRLAHRLGRDDGAGTAAIYVDQILEESCRLAHLLRMESAQLQDKGTAAKVSKARVMKQQQVRAAPLDKAGLLTLDKVERSLLLITRRRHGALEDTCCMQYLQKLALVLLEAVAVKERLVRNKEEIKVTLNHRLAQMEASCNRLGLPPMERFDCEAGGTEPRPQTAPAAPSATDVGFFQPLKNNSLLNSNYVPLEFLLSEAGPNPQQRTNV